MLIKEKSQNQEERLAYIDFYLYFLGSISRSNLMSRFGIKQAAATRDITLYKEIAPSNLDYDTAKKIYLSSESFKPYFEYNIHHALSILAHGFSTQKPFTIQESLVACEIPQVLSHPDPMVVSVITRAIKQNRVVKMFYTSVRNSSGYKEFIPFALVNTGLKWHVRGFDRETNEFSDCIFTRISSPLILDESPQKHETKEFDNQWNRIVELELIPHPNMENKEGIIADFNMDQKIKKVEIRAAVAGYFLRLWNVDCSREQNLRMIDSNGNEIGKEYQLGLGNWEALYGVKSAKWAPGYE